MMTGSRKKVYLAILAIGAVALAVDRCLLTDQGIQPSTAVAHGGIDAATVAPPGAEEPDAALSIPELPFPGGLPPLDPHVPIRDLFAPPGRAAHPDAGNQAADKQRSGGKTEDGAARAAFLTQHRLTGVLVFQRLRIAIVDGVWVRVGETVDGCGLTEVSGEQATFECHDGDVVLEVMAPSAP